MRFCLVIMLFILAGCRCSGNGNNEDADLDPLPEIDGDDRDEAERNDTEIDPPVDVETEAEDRQEDMVVDLSDAVDQLPWDCFTPFDAPGDLIPADWEPVLPDRDPTPCDGCCRQVTISPYDNTEAYDVWGNYLVYVVARSSGGYLGQIRIKHIDMQQEYIIREEERGSSSAFLGPPAIHEDKLVYPFGYDTGTDTRRCELVQVTLASGISETVHSFDVSREGWCPGSAEYIAFNGTHIAYGANKVGGTGMEQIFLFDIETREEIQISQGSCCVRQPRMWGSTVVYDGWYTYSEEIYLYNIDTGTTTNITNDDFDGRRNQRTPAVWNNLIVYVDGPYAATEQEANIVLWNLASSESTIICGNAASQLWPDISGDLIAWIDLRNDPCPNLECREVNTDIYYYRLSEGREHQLTSSYGVEAKPRIWNNRIFFKMIDADGIISIFMKEAE
jgi:hypothetical protein